jgi:hypothetical protein
MKNKFRKIALGVMASILSQVSFAQDFSFEVTAGGTSYVLDAVFDDQYDKTISMTLPSTYCEGDEITIKNLSTSNNSPLDGDPTNCNWDLAWGKWYNGAGGHTPSNAFMIGNMTSSWMSGSAVNQLNGTPMNNESWVYGTNIKIKIPTNGPSKYNVINSGSTSLEAYTLMIAPEGIPFFSGYYSGSTNCARSMRIIINVKNGPSEELLNLTGCPEESHVVDLNSNYTYSNWSPSLLTNLPTPVNTTTLSPAVTTTYSGTVTNVQGCSITDEFTISVNNLDQDLIQDQVICEDDLPYYVDIDYIVDYKITVDGIVVMDVSAGLYPSGNQFVITTPGIHIISYEYASDGPWNSNSTICTKEYNLEVISSALGLDSEYYICGKTKPNISPIGATINTEWYYSSGGSMINVHTGIFYTPTQPGNYTLVNSGSGCYSTATFEVINLGGQLNPGFDLITSNQGNYYSITVDAWQSSFPTNVPSIGYWWQVKDLTTGCTFTNYNQWWTNTYPNTANGFTNNFPEYGGSGCTPNTGYGAHGHFEYGHTYRITRGLWSGCDSWMAASAEVTLNMKTSKTRGAEEVIDIKYLKGEELEQVKASILEDVDINMNSSAEIINENKVSNTNLSVSVYPNPTNGEFNVQINNADNSVIEVINALGKTVLKLNANGNVTNIDLTNQPKGVYFVKVVSGDLMEVKRVIKN